MGFKSLIIKDQQEKHTCLVLLVFLFILPNKLPVSDLADTRGIEAVLAAKTNYSSFFWSVNGQKNMFPAQFLDGF